MLTLCLVGAILVLASLLRLGFIANFISDPVLIGFKAGIGLVIVVRPNSKLLGLHLPKGTFATICLASLETLSNIDDYFGRWTCDDRIPCRDRAVFSARVPAPLWR